ncbi:MAG: hypothetical protein JWM86_2408 [Thermoleophilia bacterium]|nr:hypothetical protein [Thermoleophilia bacterium]
MHDAALQPDRYHSFTRLELTVTESGLEGVCTDHTFELRSNRTGAEVWRSSVLHANGQSCESDQRFVGSLTSRQVVDLLDEIERSGVYEALPAFGIVSGIAEPSTAPVVTMRLVSASRERCVLDHASADRAIVHDVTEAVRKRVDIAMERALTSGG